MHSMALSTPERKDKIEATVPKNDAAPNMATNIKVEKAADNAANKGIYVKELKDKFYEFVVADKLASLKPDELSNLQAAIQANAFKKALSPAQQKALSALTISLEDRKNFVDGYKIIHGLVELSDSCKEFIADLATNVGQHFCPEILAYRQVKKTTEIVLSDDDADLQRALKESEEMAKKAGYMPQADMALKRKTPPPSEKSEKLEKPEKLEAPETSGTVEKPGKKPRKDRKPK
jgi:hypothetical protein